MKKNNVTDEKLWISLTLMFHESVFEGNMYFKDLESYAEYNVNKQITADSVPFSYGKQVWSDGSYYEGSYVNSKFNGMGIYIQSNGDLYEGNFVEAKATGYGYYYGSNGDEYEGEFKDNKFNGQGMLR